MLRIPSIDEQRAVIGGAGRATERRMERVNELRHRRRDMDPEVCAIVPAALPLHHGARRDAAQPAARSVHARNEAAARMPC